MVGPNFSLKIQPTPLHLKSRTKKPKKRTKGAKHGSSLELETIVEANIGELGKSSSYYTIRTPDDASDSVLNVIETYDEYLNLKDFEGGHPPKLPKAKLDSDRSVSDKNSSLFMLKQVCTNDLANSEKGSQILALFQNELPKASRCNIQTAVIAQRIIDTQKKIAESSKSIKSGFSKLSSRHSAFDKSFKSLLTIEGFPLCSSSIISQPLTNTLSTLTSKYLITKPKCDKTLQVNIPLISDILVIKQNCDTQTEEIVEWLFNPNFKQEKNESRYTQSTLVPLKDQSVNTTRYGQFNHTNRATQMYEHITENDLLCMEWINKNFFRVPVNPNVVIVDEKVRDLSEMTCLGTNIFEQEANWEIQALYS